MRYNPSSQLKNHSKIEDAKDLLKVEIGKGWKENKTLFCIFLTHFGSYQQPFFWYFTAGIKATPNHYYSLPGVEESNEWLKQLALNRIPISCTLLSRRKIGMMPDNPIIDVELEQSAIGCIKYRPKKAFFRQDLATSLVRNGRAGLASGMHIDIENMPTIDGSTKIGDIDKDVKYLDILSSNEFEAVKDRKGIWSIDSIRNERPDLVEEAEFEINAGLLRKLWRRITQR